MRSTAAQALWPNLIGLVEGKQGSNTAGVWARQPHQSRSVGRYINVTTKSEHVIAHVIGSNLLWPGTEARS